MERFAHRRHIGGDTDLIRLAQAPAVMIAYAAGVSAVARRRDDLVNRLFVEPTCEDHAGSRRDQMLRILDPDLLGVPQPARHLYELLRPTIADLLGLGEDRYLTAWERWEYLHQLYRYNGRLSWVPHLRVEGVGPNEGRPTTAVKLSLELARLGQDHPLVAGGLFDLSTLQDQITAFDNRFKELADDWDFALTSTAGGGWLLPSARHYPGSHDEA